MLTKGKVILGYLGYLPLVGEYHSWVAFPWRFSFRNESMDKLGFFIFGIVGTIEDGPYRLLLGLIITIKRTSVSLFYQKYKSMRLLLSVALMSNFHILSHSKKYHKSRQFAQFVRVTSHCRRTEILVNVMTRMNHSWKGFTILSKIIMKLANG